MRVKFLIDSASDVLPEEAKQLGVTHLPMRVTFGDETFSDAVDLSHSQFYEKLAANKELPVTSQINPADFSTAFADAVADGSELVVITISSGLSGTYQSAVIAAEDYPGKVFVVDSLSATVGERILLMRGLELAAAGVGAEEIAKTLDEEKGRIRVFAMIDTLEYLKKGGRISSTVAFAGGLLGIKPAIEVKDGKVAMAGTARGVRKCHELLSGLIAQYGGVNWEKPVAFIYSESDASLQQFIRENPQLWGGREDLLCCSLGGTIGTHVGPGAYGLAFFEK